MSETDKANEIDSVTGIETTGHSWDGIRELNNPLPRWWLWTFYATIVFSAGYMIYYPSIPLVEGSTLGISGQTNRLQLKRDMAAVAESRRERIAKIEATELEAVQADEDLYRFAVAGGASLYRVHCSQCHGSGAQGAPGFPNLNDDAWIWGGNLQSIYTTIRHGVRNDHDPDARYSEMPAFGEILESERVSQVAEFVLQLSGQGHDADLASEGSAVYGENCAACHGEDGRGDREVGAPDLADSVWLYGGDRESIRLQIRQPSHGVMPAWQGRVREASIKQLALYVHSLGGGE